MGTLLDFLPIRKNQFSPEFIRELPLMIERLEREYRRPIGVCHPWPPVQQECFELAHQGLSGLLENGGVTL